MGSEMTTKELERRLDKLERDLGASDDPRFVAVVVLAGETKEEALGRALAENALGRDQVAQVLFLGPGGEEQMETVDLIPGAAEMELAGRREFWDELYRTIKGRGEQRISTTLVAKLEADEHA